MASCSEGPRLTRQPRGDSKPGSPPGFRTSASLGRHYSSRKKVPNGVPWQVERIQMPYCYSHSTALVLRAPPPVTVAFARPAPDMPLHKVPPYHVPPSPGCRGGPGGGQSGHCRFVGRWGLGGARPATLGLSRPFQAAMWGVPGQLAAGRPRFFARLGSASLSNI